MQKLHTVSIPTRDPSMASPGDPCIMVLFGASGDLAKRLLMPALYNLLLDGLLPAQFALVGISKDELTTDSFRERMSKDIRTFNTRKDFNDKAWQDLCGRLYYLPGDFADAAAFIRLRELVGKLDTQYQTKGNVLFYLAVPPAVFGLISVNIDKAGFKQSSPHAVREDYTGWRRIIVEKPFGTDLHSAEELNRQILSHWDESQVYRVDHYLGKETVQNILAFRFANGMFEPLWNRQYVDHIQFSVTESVSVEGRGAYYDRSGVLRDMIQNHMFQMLAYVCMEPPGSFAADDIRDEKAKLLKAVRVYKEQEVGENAVRGQYGSGKTAGGAVVPDYRQEPDVNPKSTTETYAALRLFIDNWRWDGVPFYLRSGKALWKRGTEVVVQFKKPPDTLFRGTAVAKLSANRLIFHIQPDQGIESCFQAKTPGPRMRLQPVNMRFSYGEAFHAAPGTGYEVMIFSCMIGDATLFSRTDLVEAAWRIAQPFLDAWPKQPVDFPNYGAGTWGPKAASDLIDRDGRRWYEIITREMLERVPLFKGGDPVFLNQISMALKPRVAPAGAVIVSKGDQGNEMFLICRGEVDVLDGHGNVMTTLREGDIFGEVALLLSEPRTATVRAKTMCDLFVLDKADFGRILRDQQQFAAAIKKIALERYDRQVAVEQLMGQG